MTDIHDGPSGGDFGAAATGFRPERCQAIGRLSRVISHAFAPLVPATASRSNAALDHTRSIAQNPHDAPKPLFGHNAAVIAAPNYGRLDLAAVEAIRVLKQMAESHPDARPTKAAKESRDRLLLERANAR